MELIPNAINTDIKPINSKVQKLDIEQFPYYFPDNYFDEIHAKGIIKYICPKNFYQLMEEIWRISKPNTKIYISHRNNNTTKCRTRMTAHEFNCFTKENFHNHITTARFQIQKYWKTRPKHIRTFLIPTHNWILKTIK